MQFLWYINSSLNSFHFSNKIFHTNQRRVLKFRSLFFSLNFFFLTYQPQAVETGKVALGLSLEAIHGEHLGPEAHPTLVHHVGGWEEKKGSTLQFSD